jgi:anti-anti-sigma factor
VFGSFESHYFTFQVLGGVVVARCLMGNLSEEENIDPVGQELLTLVDKYECRRIILDLSEVEYMTSAMVGKMIRVHRQMHRDNGKLVLCQLHPTVYEILHTSKLLTYFNTTNTVEEAVAMFGDVAEGPEESDDSGPDDLSQGDTVDEI